MSFMKRPVGWTIFYIYTSICVVRFSSTPHTLHIQLIIQSQQYCRYV